VLRSSVRKVYYRECPTLRRACMVSLLREKLQMGRESRDET
jgi:hypothetical protein